MAAYAYLCPICIGDGGPHCACDGSGLITETDAAEWRAEFGVELEPAPRPPARMSEPCVDCAFRHGSPESDNIVVLETLVQGVEDGRPFFCHQGMHCNSRGEYVPLASTADGIPVGYPICAGWREARAKRRAGVAMQQHNILHPEVL